MAKPQIVKVVWVDITSYGDKRILSAVKDLELITMETFGALVEETPERVAVAHCLSHIPNEDELLGSEITIIPKGAIIFTEYLGRIKCQKGKYPAPHLKL